MDSRLRIGEWEGEGDGGAEVGAGAGGGDVAAVLAGDGADQEEAEAGAFDLDSVAAGDAVEALEDALELVGGEADAGVGDGERDLGVARRWRWSSVTWTPLGEYLTALSRMLRTAVRRSSGKARTCRRTPSGDGGELDGVGGEVVALEGDGDAVGDQRGEFEQGAVLVAAAGAEFAGLEDLLDGAEQAVGVGEHDLVELLALGFGDVAALKGFEVEADGGDGSFELVGDGVEEGVLALVAADFADQEDGVEDDAGDEHARRR